MRGSRSRAGLTVQALEAREHGPRPSNGPRLTRARLTGSPFQERADLVAGTSRTAHEGRSRSPRWPFSARYRASAPIQALEAGRAHEGTAHGEPTGSKHEGRSRRRSRAGLTVGLMATGWTGPKHEGTAHGGSRRSWTGSRAHGSPAHRRPGPSPRSTRTPAGRPRTVQGRARSTGCRPVQGRADGLTVRARSTRARLTAHRRAHEPVQAPEAREPGRRPSNGPGLTRARLTVQALQAREHGPRGHGSGLTSRSGRRADGHELDPLTVGLTAHRAGPGPRSTRARPTAHERDGLEARGPRGPVQGRAHEGHGSRLTVGLMATSWTAPKHESTAHGPGPRSSKLDGLTVGLTSWTARPSSCRGPGSPFTGRSGRRADGHELDRPDLRAGSKHEGTAHGLTAHGSPAHGFTAHRLTGSRLTVGLKATSWTGPTFEPSRAGLTVQGSRRSWTGSPSKPSKHESPAHGLTAHRRADGHELDRPDRRAHEPVQALQAREPGRAPSNGPGLTRARLTAHRRAEGHELDRPDLRAVQGSRRSWTARSTRAAASPGPGPGSRLTVQGRAHRRARPSSCRGPGSRLTVQAPAHRPSPRSTRVRLTGSRLTVGLMATSWTGPTVGLTSPSKPSKHESRADGPRTVQGSREHGSRAHRGPKATSWTGPTFESRGQSRAGLTGGLETARPSRAGLTGGLETARPSRAGLTVQALEAREPGRQAHRRARSTRARPTALERSTAHEGTAHGSPARPSKLDGPKHEGRGQSSKHEGTAHGPVRTSG